MYATPPVDTGTPDFGVVIDAGASDLGVDGGALLDACEHCGIDANFDAGPIDTGVVDSGPPDTGTCAQLWSGPIGWWPGNADSLDVVGTATGAWVGTATYAAAKVGQGFLFTGSNHVVASTFQYTGPFSVDFWVKAKVAGQGVYAAPLSSSLGAQDPYFQFDFDGTGNYRIQAGSDRVHVPIGVASTSAFQHLAMTYTGTVISTYMNGTFSSSATWPGSTLRFEVAKFGLNRTENDPFQGIVDEVHIWNRVLTSTEVGAIFKADFYGLCH
jgi:hypothetical protein